MTTGQLEEKEEEHGTIQTTALLARISRVEAYPSKHQSLQQKGCQAAEGECSSAQALQQYAMPSAL
jgi:hypothetical protein